MMRGKWQDRVKAVEQRALTYQSAPISCPYKARLSRPWQPSSVWRLFPRQKDAIAFSQRCKQDIHVFALEKESTDAGQRVYLVTSYTELWHYYSSHRRSLMHCYEVIPEGAVCKLYFDLEFDAASNTHLDGTRMVASLIQYVCVKLEEVYRLQCSAKHVLNLDSSTDDKFSRHLIFLLHDCAFKDNWHVGRFIHHILKPALKHLYKGSENSEDDVSEEPRSKRTKHDEQDEGDLSFLVVKGKNGQKQLFVDLGVYTKNRNFRLYKSSKLGKNAAFSVAQDNQFVPDSSKHATEDERIFLASLITNVSIIVDLKEEVWYQRCHDPECRRQNYRSSSYPLPQEVCMSYMLKEDEDDQQFLMDEQGNIEASPRCAPEEGTDGAASHAQECWDDDDEDDASYLEALDEVERNMEENEEIPDELMIQALTECENTLAVMYLYTVVWVVCH